MLYKNLPRNVGLKRLTLHKSATGPNVNYILLVECSHFLDNINQVSNQQFLIPKVKEEVCYYLKVLFGLLILEQKPTRKLLLSSWFLFHNS